PTIASLSLHDALPISAAAVPRGVAGRRVTSVASASVGYWQVLHRRPGNRFLLGLAASGFGDSLVPLATAFAILHLTGSVALLGVAPGVSRVPALVVTLLGGVSEVPLVDDAARLAHRPLDLLRRDDVDPHGDPDGALDQVRQLGPGLGGLGAVHSLPVLDPHRQRVHPALSGEHALEVRRQLGDAEDQLLDLGGEHVHTADDHHVVGPPPDLLDPAHRAGGPRQQAGTVPGAVPDHGHGLLG